MAGTLVNVVALASVVGVGSMLARFRSGDALPSWNDGPSKRAIVDFVRAVTARGTSTYVRPTDRIAVFDNDGTLWSEMPIPVQAAFIVDRVRALVPQHPEYSTRQPYKAILEGDMDALSRMSHREIAEVIAATHAGMTTEEFAGIVGDWLATARHPQFDRPYTECVFQPMLELLAFLRANGFRTFIVSGGGIDFLRVFSEQLYGVLPAQVIGSSSKTRYELRDGAPVLVKLPDLGSVDDKEGKVINIHLHIGQRPIFAMGNADGDLAMLTYTGHAPGTHLSMLVRHDDAEREFAYDRDGSFWGKLDAGLEMAKKSGWPVVSPRTEWVAMFPADRRAARARTRPRLPRRHARPLLRSRTT